MKSSENGSSTCSRCGESFTCGNEAGLPSCWCADLPAVMPLPDVPGCLCPRCLPRAIGEAIETFLDKTPKKDALARAQSFNKAEPPREHIDFVNENGQVVFTRWFLLKQGSCCDSGCRNCPF